MNNHTIKKISLLALVGLTFVSGMAVKSYISNPVDTGISSSAEQLASENKQGIEDDQNNETNTGSNFLMPESPFKNETEMKDYKNDEIKTFYTELLSYSKEELLNFSDEEISDFLVQFTPLTKESLSDISKEYARSFFEQYIELKDLSSDELKDYLSSPEMEENIKAVFYDLEEIAKEYN